MALGTAAMNWVTITWGTASISNTGLSRLAGIGASRKQLNTPTATPSPTQPRCFPFRTRPSIQRPIGNRPPSFKL